MEKQNLIIGGFTNYEINQIKPWVISAKQAAPNAHIVLCVGKTSQSTINWIREQDIEIVGIPQNDNVPIHVLRFVSIHNYLMENWQKFRFVLTTDVKDVIFQTDPFEFLKNTIDNTDYRLLAGSEGIRYKDEDWGNENLMQSYGPYIHEMHKNNEIYNVGVLGGVSEYVKDLVFHIFTNAINRPIAICDQAVYNVLSVNQPFKNVTKFLQQKDGWACHAGTTVDPSKIERFRPFLTEKEPIFEDGLVKTCDSIPFSIVHQYDRVPVWKKFVAEKYSQEDESQYYIFRT